MDSSAGEWRWWWGMVQWMEMADFLNSELNKLNGFLWKLGLNGNFFPPDATPGGKVSGASGR